MSIMNTVHHESDPAAVSLRNENCWYRRVTEDVVTFLCYLFVIFFSCPPFSFATVYPGACQQLKRRKDAGENRIRPGGKRVKRPLKPKEGGGKGQSLLTQVLDKGRFLRLGQSITLTPGKNMELRCKGNSIGWSYPTYLDTFNDSRLRWCKNTSAVWHVINWCKSLIVLLPASSIKHSDKYSQLILTSPSAADTGPYSCWVIVCDGTECEKDHDRSYVSYIYFTGD